MKKTEQKETCSKNPIAMLVMATAFIAIGCDAGGNVDADDKYVRRITTIEQFDTIVLKADKPVLVDFFATWCGPCRQLAAVIHDLAREYEGRVIFVKVDADKVRELARKYKIRSIPDVRIFRDGKSVRKLIGLQNIDQYRSALNAVLSATH